MRFIRAILGEGLLIARQIPVRVSQPACRPAIQAADMPSFRHLSRHETALVHHATVDLGDLYSLIQFICEVGIDFRNHCAW